MSAEVQLAKPLGDRVLIKVDSGGKKIGGIIIPDTVQDGDNKFGIIVSIGNGIYTQNGTKIPMEVSVGDKVLLPHGGMNIQKIKLDDTEYFLCREMDLLMVIK
jgi:chaperonin GroES